jgi:NAD(P)-dependent dehydrogenase (short-subunit alcohol dehydrogenase family)
MPGCNVDDDLTTEGIAEQCWPPQVHSLDPGGQRVPEARDVEYLVRVAAVAEAWQVGQEDLVIGSKAGGQWQHVAARQTESVDQHDLVASATAQAGRSHHRTAIEHGPLGDHDLARLEVSIDALHGRDCSSLLRMHWVRNVWARSLTPAAAARGPACTASYPFAEPSRYQSRSGVVGEGQQPAPTLLEETRMRLQLKPLKQQVIVITGASSGIGLTTARLAAARGARVVLAARDEASLVRITDLLRAQGAEAVFAVADVADEAAVARIADTAVRAFGGFDSWVNNAGVSVYGRLDVVPIADQRRVFETNYWGVVHGSLAALRHLRHCGGAVINVGSVLSERAFPLQGAYSASKHALKGFTDALRMELIHDGVPVSVTLIKPTAIDTPYARHAENYLDRQPTNPPPNYAPDIVARAVLYAASHPVRELNVGGSGRLLETFDHWLPALTDTVMGAVVPGLEHGAKLSDPRPPSGLHAPAGGVHERSGTHRFVREHSVYTAAAMHPLACLAVAGVIGAALVFMSYIVRNPRLRRP